MCVTLCRWLTSRLRPSATTTRMRLVFMASVSSRITATGCTNTPPMAQPAAGEARWAGEVRSKGTAWPATHSDYVERGSRSEGKRGKGQLSLRQHLARAASSWSS